MEKDNKKVLYERIMTSLAEEVKKSLNESTVAHKIKTRVYNVLFYDLAPEIQGETVTLNDIAHEPRFLKKIAGYLIEEKVKAAISRSFLTKTDYGYIKDKTDPQYKDGGDNWWDFSIDGEKVEVKAFLKGTMHSNVHVTLNQAEHKNELTFMLVEYMVVGGAIKITGIAFVDGSEMEINSSGRFVYNPNIQFKRPTQELY